MRQKKTFREANGKDICVKRYLFNKLKLAYKKYAQKTLKTSRKVYPYDVLASYNLVIQSAFEAEINCTLFKIAQKQKLCVNQIRNPEEYKKLTSLQK